MSKKVDSEVVRVPSRLRHWRQRYQKGAAYIWRKSITWEGEKTVVGAQCPESLTSNPKKVRLFWEAKTIELRDFDGNNPGKKFLRHDGSPKPADPSSNPTPPKPAEPAKAEDLVSGSGRKWSVKGLEEVFTSKGAATAAAKELLEKQAADAAAKKAAEEAAASKDKPEGEGNDADLDDTTLLGSNVQPSEVEIKPGEKVQLGEVVVFAHKASGLSVKEWNELSDEDREAKLEAAIVEMGKEEEKDPLEE